MLRRVLLALLWLSCPAALAQGQAQDTLTLDHAMRAAYCEQGKGCHSCVVPHSHRSVIRAVGLEGVEPGDILVVSPTNGTWGPSVRRVDSTWRLGLMFGGEGRDLLPSCYDRPPLPGALQPEDGTWQMTAGDIRVQNCPDEIRQGVEQAVKVQTVRQRFRRPFLGALTPEEPEMVQISPNAFRKSVTSGDVQAWTGLVVTGTDRMSLYTNTQVPHPETGRMCSFSVTVEMVRTGD